MSYRTELRCDIIGCAITASFDANDEKFPPGWRGFVATNDYTVTTALPRRHACPKHALILLGEEAKANARPA